VRNIQFFSFFSRRYGPNCNSPISWKNKIFLSSNWLTIVVWSQVYLRCTMRGIQNDDLLVCRFRHFTSFDFSDLKQVANYMLLAKLMFSVTTASNEISKQKSGRRRLRFNPPFFSDSDMHTHRWNFVPSDSGFMDKTLGIWAFQFLCSYFLD